SKKKGLSRSPLCAPGKPEAYSGTADGLPDPAHTRPTGPAAPGSHATPLRRAANNPRWTQHKGAVKPYIITAFLCPKTTFYETPAHLRTPRTAARQALAPDARRQDDGPGERHH